MLKYYLSDESIPEVDNIELVLETVVIPLHDFIPDSSQDHLTKKCLEILHCCPNGCDDTLRMKLPEVTAALGYQYMRLPEVQYRYNML